TTFRPAAWRLNQDKSSPGLSPPKRHARQSPVESAAETRGNAVLTKATSALRSNPAVSMRADAQGPARITQRAIVAAVNRIGIDMTIGRCLKRRGSAAPTASTELIRKTLIHVT